MVALTIGVPSSVWDITRALADAGAGFFFFAAAAGCFFFDADDDDDDVFFFTMPVVELGALADFVADDNRGIVNLEGTAYCLQ
jgi:hypothetical protein